MSISMFRGEIRSGLDQRDMYVLVLGTEISAYSMQLNLATSPSHILSGYVGLQNRHYQ